MSPQPFAVPGADRALAAARYDGVPRRLVIALKFAGRLALAGVAADAIARALGPDPPAGTLVPVPSDPWRHRLRGFDPATEIASALSPRLELPLSHCLSRRHAPRQVGRPRAERLAVNHSVRALGVTPATAILVDDVATTGTTLAGCARSLRAAGAEEILALAFAQA